MTSFIDVGTNLDEVKEPELLDSGTYMLRITDAKLRQSEDTGEYDSIMVTLEAEDQPDSAPIFHYIYLPTKKCDDRQLKGRLIFLKRFLNLFKIPYDGGKFNVDSFLGREALCVVRKTSFVKGDGTTAERNEIVLPKV